MVRVTETEFDQNPDRFRHLAAHEPVTVTASDPDQMVIPTAQEYHRLKRRDRRVMTLEDFTDEDIAAIENARAPEEADAFNHEWQG